MCRVSSAADKAQEIAERHTRAQLQPTFVAWILPNGIEMLGIDSRQRSLSEDEAQSRLDHLLNDPCPPCEEALGMKLQDVCPHPQFTSTNLDFFPETGALGRALRTHYDDCETCAASMKGRS